MLKQEGEMAASFAATETYLRANGVPVEIMQRNTAAAGQFGERSAGPSKAMAALDAAAVGMGSPRAACCTGSIQDARLKRILEPVIFWLGLFRFSLPLDGFAENEKKLRWLGIALYFLLIVSCSRKDIPIAKTVNAGEMQMENHQIEVRSMKDVHALYTSSEQDWFEFLGCWNEQLVLSLSAIDEHGPVKAILQQSKNRLAKVGSQEFIDRLATLETISARLHLPELPGSFRHFAAISGGNWIASVGAAEAGLKSDFIPLERIGLFKDVDPLNWGSWHKAVAGATPESMEVPASKYYRYDDGQDHFRWNYLDKLVKVGELEQGAVLLINPLDITADGEWEAWLLSPQVGAHRYKSFAELMQTIAYQEIRRTGGINIPREKLESTCGGHLKTAATLPRVK